MKPRNITIGFVGSLFILMSGTASAITSSLYDYAFNEDGVITAGIPGAVNLLTLGLDANGLGTFSFTIEGTGSHNIDAFFDFEFDEVNNTFFNEYGNENGALGAGQSWEIDEPGYIFGDIYDNVSGSTLDNTNSVPIGSEEDVSFALGWDFNLLAGQIAQISFTVSDILETSGFYLQHTDAEVGASFDISESIYFWSDISIIDEDVISVQAPTASALMSIGLLGLIASIRRKKVAKNHTNIS